MNTYNVYVNNGYRYEYETTIVAKSVVEARAIWKQRGDRKTIDFRVSKQPQGESVDRVFSGTLQHLHQHAKRNTK